MDNVKNTIAKNITNLRLANNMTQVELGERLNYSDKAVSKWERAESIPDVTVLVEIAKLFGVTLDYLVSGDNAEVGPADSNVGNAKYNRKAITYISENIVWFVAIFAFVITTLITRHITFQWLYFLYSLPIALIVRLVFNTIWFNPRYNYLIISILMWSILIAIQITFFYFKINVALIYLLGVAGQTTIILWSFIKKPKKNKKEL